MMNWPNKAQRRVLRELAEVTRPGGSFFHEERLAKRLDMPVEEVRRHLQALADLGMVQECPGN
jgi:DNA-binding IclR family transcriptional regulator